MEVSKCYMSKFYHSKHHCWGAVEGNLKGKSKTGTASFSISCKQEKWVSSLQTSLSVTMTEKKSKYRRKAFILHFSPEKKYVFHHCYPLWWKTEGLFFFLTEVKLFCRYADRSILIFKATSWGNIYGFNKFVRTNDCSVKPLTLG